MKKQSYSDKLKSPKWQKKRLEIMRRDKFTCKKCGDTETSLHVHHLQYCEDDPWLIDNKLLVTLCEDCHNIIEQLKTEHPDIPFAEIKIYKSDNWKGGSKIIFTSLPHVCSMTIYDDDGEWLCGYNLDADIPYIIKILKHSYNG